MASALKLAVATAVFVLAGSAVNAGSAPAAYYPSLGYGQTPPSYYYAPPDRPTGDVDPADPDYGPHAPPPDVRDDPPSESFGPPPVVDREGYSTSGRAWRSDDDEGYARQDVRTYDYDSGWRVQESEAPMACPFAHERPDYGPPPRGARACPSVQDRFGPYDERIPDGFFADSGGVGPAFLEGGGGGGYVIGGSGGGHAFASARASASASARVSVGVRVHGGGGHFVRHSCGCGR